MAEAQQRIHDALKRATAALDCPTALMTLARHKACTAFKARWLAQGRKLAELTAGDVRIAAEEYLNKHPELFQQAAETIKRSRKLRKLAERETRERARCAKLSSDAQRLMR